MWMIYTWRGKPIHDIKAWARERGEQMVSWDVWVENLWTVGGAKIFSHSEEAPASFFDNMRFTDERRNVQRYEP